MKQVNVGDDVYVVVAGDRARMYNEKQYSGKVIEVGRKFFTVEFDGWNKQFHLENWRQKTEYSPDFVLYESKQDYEDIVEFERLKRLMLDELKKYAPSFTLTQLRQAAEMLGISQEARG